MPPHVPYRPYYHENSSEQKMNKITGLLAKAKRRLIRQRLEVRVEDTGVIVDVRCVWHGWDVGILLLESRWGAELLEVPVDVDKTGFKAQVSLSDLIDTFGHDGSIIDLSVSFKRQPDKSGEKQKQQVIRLGRFKETIQKLATGAVDLEKTPVSIYVTEKNNISLVIGADVPAKPPRVTTRRMKSAADGTDFEIVVRHPSIHFKVAHLIVTGRQTQKRKLITTDLKFDSVTTTREYGRYNYRVNVTLKTKELAAWLCPTEDTIDLSLELETDTGDILSERIFLRNFNALIRPERTKSVEHEGTTFVFVPYRTFRGHKLSYRVERFSPEAFSLLKRAKWLGWLAPIVSPFLGIWLVGEIPYKAQDNGYSFFKYIRTQYPRRRVYYVINENSPDRAKVEKLGNVVFQYSKEHILLNLLASRIVGTHHAEYLLASRSKWYERWVSGVRIFLQHGPTAQKNVTLNYGRQGTQEKPTERFLVTSDLEKKIVVEDYGYRPHQVKVVGFARFDSLLNADTAKEPIILIMPTWRDTLMDEQSFLASNYYMYWRGLLVDSEFRQCLNDAGLSVTFVLHPNMRNYADYFNINGVKLMRQDDVDVQKLIKQSSVMVTDYSSVAWDFSYLDRPVLYFQFDVANLQGSRKPHIDFQNSLPGPIASCYSDLVDDLKTVIANDFELESKYKQRSRAFLKFDDQNNCARIYDTVRSAWTPLTALERLRNAKFSQKIWRRFRRHRIYTHTMSAVAWVGGRLPRRDLVLFESDRGESYGDAPKYIYERLIERDHGLKIVWANNTTVRFADENTEKVMRYSPRYWWLASRARYWVSNQNMPAAMIKPPSTHFLQTWHGTPLKRMQHDVPDMKGRDANYEKRAKRLTSYWDTLISGSEYATQAFRSAFRYDREVLEVGYPRNDLFFWPDRKERQQRAKARLGISKETRKIVLYAPTFRDDNRGGRWWRHALHLDLENFTSELGKDYLLLTRFHPLVRNPLPADFRNSKFILDVSRYPDVQELLLMTDVLVTDYSSLFFDFANLDKPMIFFAYDLDKYRDDIRGFYLDYEKNMPGPIVRTTPELIQAIRNTEVPNKQYEDVLTDFRKIYNSNDDGNASDRVIDSFFNFSGKHKK